MQGSSIDSAMAAGKCMDVLECGNNSTKLESTDC